MATQYDNAIQQLYVAYFNRPADASGITFWANAMANGVTAEQVSAAFAASEEYKTEYNQSTYTGVVTQVYDNLFGRAPDATGLAFWVNALTNKTLTIDNVVDFIARGAQDEDKEIIAAKVKVATAFTEALNTDAEKAGYSGDKANEKAKELLSTIKTDDQANDAIVPATLDASVAAVVKAGTPFTLESGLAALGAAQANLADFLEEQDATTTEIGTAVTEARGDLADQIDNNGFATATPGVQAALIADQVEYNADALEAANEGLAEAQEAVAEVTGLSNAVVAVTSAKEVAEEARDANIEATANFDIAENTFDVRSAGTTTGTLNAGTYAILNKDGVTIASLKEGVVSLAKDVKVADYAGLQGLIDAANASLAASAEARSAADAALIAEFQVAVLENPESSLAGFTFALTNPGTSKSVSEIADELAATAAAGHANYTVLRGQIDAFLLANDTPLANAVVAIEEGLLAQAEADVANQDGLSEAVALIAAEGAVITARAGVANTVTIDPVSGAITATAGGASIATVNGEGKLVYATGATPSNYVGLTAFVSAFNAEVDAQEAYDDQNTGMTAQAFVAEADNKALLDEVAEQQGYIDAAPANTTANATAYANYLAALGVEGAQARVEELAEAIEALEDAQAVATELKALQDAITAASADFTANEYNAPAFLGTAAFGRAGSDIFVVDHEATTTSTISNFGRSGDDVLYVGAGYTFNDGDVAEDGNNAVLEVFFTQRGNNTIVTIETETFGSNSSEAEIVITLTGVNADELTFENGIITL